MSSLLLRHARLVPLGPGAAAPEDPVDLLLRDGEVAAVGRDLAAPAGTEVHDAEGRWVSPGLWDQHVHLGQWAQVATRLDLSSARSPEDAVAIVEHHLAVQPGVPLVGWGHRSVTWHREPLVEDLDRVARDVPVILISGDGHHAWLNSAGLAVLDLPWRDDVVREQEWFAAYERLPRLVGDEGTSPAAYRAVQEQAASRGIVGVVDFEFSGGAAEWAERWSVAGLLRIRMATYAEGLPTVLGAGLRTGDPLPGCDDRALMGPLKIISDGSLNTRTAWCCAPYADGDFLEHPSGAPNLTGLELRALLREAHGHGLEIAVHAIGDAAVREALDAYEETGATGSIEHAQLIDPRDVPRLAELGIRASVQPAHLLDDRDVTEQCWPDRSGRSFALRWLLDAGVEVRLGSDAPVAPLDPWLAMAAAVHRSGDDRPAWHPEHALTAAEALAASTDGWGTVAPGHPADLVLLDADPLGGTGEPEKVARHLLEVPAAATYIGGNRVFLRP
ncbi:amidohydrolase [Nocardioides donggukensis]|uniref:Amidohydrolase family protein n=1 Tax=Nocardioides donggukensis TaxID=2774019 RepID=A0A927PZW4_9ACTN|nr:amidohydrolase family protein [Nocardioides donggukensis]MBD8869835.1 amidohydrolase family protein [Nocardioides donggukensis]